MIISQQMVTCLKNMDFNDLSFLFRMIHAKIPRNYLLGDVVHVYGETKALKWHEMLFTANDLNSCPVK